MNLGWTAMAVAGVAWLGAAHSLAQEPGVAVRQTSEVPSPEGQQAAMTSVAKQFALYVVLCSSSERGAGLPGSNAQHPEVLQFIKDVPVEWSDARVLNREAGDYVTIARKDHHSDDWYLGAITHEQPRTLRIRLDFLDADKRYRATIYREGPDVSTGQGEEVVIETRPVSRFDSMQLKLAAGGGLAMRITSERVAPALSPTPRARPKPRPPPPPEFDVE